MPDARLQRTRDAYPDELPERQTVICTSRSDELLILSQGSGYMFRVEQTPPPPPAEPSDDDLWGV